MSNVYTRSDSGSLDRIDLMCLDDDPGRINLGGSYNPVSPRKVGTTVLRGWGRDDGEADVYETDAGREIIVPGRVRDQVATQLAASD